MFTHIKIHTHVKAVPRSVSQNPAKARSFRLNHNAGVATRPSSARYFATVNSETRTDPFSQKASKYPIFRHLIQKEHPKARPGSKEALQHSDFAAEADGRNFVAEPDYDRPSNADPKSTYTDGHPHDVGLKHPFKSVLNSAEEPAKPSVSAETSKAKDSSPSPTVEATTSKAKEPELNKEASTQTCSTMDDKDFPVTNRKPLENINKSEFDAKAHPETDEEATKQTPLL